MREVLVLPAAALLLVLAGCSGTQSGSSAGSPSASSDASSAAAPSSTPSASSDGASSAKTSVYLKFVKATKDPALKGQSDSTLESWGQAACSDVKSGKDAQATVAAIKSKYHLAESSAVIVTGAGVGAFCPSEQSKVSKVHV